MFSTKLLKKSLITLGSLSTLSLPIFTNISFASKSLNQKDSTEFIFDGRTFSSEEDAIKYLVQYNKVKIRDVKVWGKLSSAYSNYESGLLNKSELPSYNKDNINLAYFNAGRGVVKGYDDAKNTYYNPGRIRTMYVDGFTDTKYISEAQAKAAAQQYKKAQLVTYYKDIPFIEGKSIVKKNINAFNKNDLEAWKDNIKNNIETIILNNIKNDTNQSYSISFYDKDFENKKTDSNFNISLGKNYWSNLINKYSKNNNHVSSNISINGSTINSTLTNQSAYSKLKSDWKIIGDWQWNDESKNNVFAKFNNDNLLYTVRNYGTRWSWQNSSTKNYWDLSRNQFGNFLKGKLNNYSTSSRWIKQGDLANKNNDNRVRFTANQSKQELINYLNKMSRNISSKSFSDILPTSFKNDNLSSFLKEKITSLIASKISSKTNLINPFYNVTSLPSFQISGRDGKFWSFSEAKEDNYVKVDDRNYTFKYKETSSVNFNDKDFISLSKINDSNKQLIKELLSWKPKEEKYIKLSFKELNHNDDSSSDNKNVFQIPLTLNSEGEITISKNKNIEFDEEVIDTPQSLSSNFNTMSARDMLDNLYNELQNANETNVVGLFDKYFGINGYYYKRKDAGDIGYQSPITQSGNQAVIDYEKNIKNIWKFQLYNLFKLYTEDASYKSNSTLLLGIASQIPNSNKFIKLPESKTKSNKNVSVYLMSSISDFNPMLTSGVFGDKAMLAKNNDEFQQIKLQDSSVVPAHILIAYSNNGQEINPGNYQYDSEILLELNIKNSLSPQRDFDHMFVREKDLGPWIKVANNTYIIKRLKIDNHDLYFDSYRSLKEYLLKYIKARARKI